MQIVKTWDELNPLVDGLTVGRVVLSRKKSADQIHAGHLNLVNYAKANYDICVVTLWNSLEFIYWFYPDDNLQTDLADKVWDSTGCLNWCELNGVDYVFLPDDGYTSEYMYGYDRDIAKSNLDALWNSRQYPEITSDAIYNYMRSPKSIMMYLDWKSNQRPSTWAYIDTWKDGCSRLILNDHMNRIKPNFYVMLDPILNEDGLYYSSASLTYTQNEIDIVKAIPGIVDSYGYADISGLQEELKTQLDPDGTYGFDAYRIHVTYGGVAGAANDFIEVYFEMGYYPNSSKKRSDMYPIYKLNVR